MLEKQIIMLCVVCAVTVYLLWLLAYQSCLFLEVKVNVIAE